MKAKKLISKGLALGFILNSFSALSYANTDIPNRYQTLEGEYITIDDSTEGNLEDIEIVGDTWQDSDSKNLLNEELLISKTYLDRRIATFNNSINVINQTLYSFAREIHSEIKLKKGTYTLSMSNIIFSNLNEKIYVATSIEYNNSTIATVNTTNGLEKMTFTVSEDTTYNIVTNVLGTYLGSVSFNIQLEEGSVATSYVPYYKADLSNIQHLGELYIDGNGDAILDKEGREQYKYEIKSSNSQDSTIEDYKSFTQTILLPTQLMRIGEIRDKLYWDNNKGIYVIEKNIGRKEHTTISKPFIIMENYVIYRFNMFNDMSKSAKVLSNRLYNNASTLPYIQGDGAFYRMYLPLNINTDLTFKEWFDKGNITIYYQLATPQIIETNIIKKISLPTYEGKTYVNIKSDNNTFGKLKISVDRILKVSEELVIEFESNPTILNLSRARMIINQLPESLYKDQLQARLNSLSIEGMVINRKTATSNIDVYIKSENMLSMTLNTNSITFDDFSGVEDMTKENALQISINSSLPYSLSAYLPIEIQNNDKSNTMDKQILNIKENSESIYQTFSNINEKLILKDNNSAGNNVNHSIDIKLKGNIAHQKDVYKTTIKFEVQQK